MKTHRNLWDRFSSFENLYYASLKAQKGKRYKKEVLKFNFNIEKHVIDLQKKLNKKRYQPGKYYSFEIKEPKKRIIHAAPFVDRVVHHAIINIIEPVFEKSFYYHSYACRKGKGAHRAVNICHKFTRRNNFCLKCDISKYFQSIDHITLKGLIRKRIADPELLILIDAVIDSSPHCEGGIEYFFGDDLFSPINRKRGIPIGNLTSQFFANLYLNELDRFVKQNLMCRDYVRYMDDFLIFSNSKEKLAEFRNSIIRFLDTIRLCMHPQKREIFPVKNGVPFLGFNIYPNTIRLKKENIQRFMNRMKYKRYQFQKGMLSRDDLRNSINAWIGHVKHGNTWRLRETLFDSLIF